LQSRIELFDTGTKKREAPSEATDGLDQVKRAKLGANILPQRIEVSPLPPGPTTLAELFTVTKDESLSSFHVEQLPFDIVAKITLSLLSKVDQDMVNDTVTGIRRRYVSLQNQAPAIQSGVTGVDDEEDDYEPEFIMTEDNEQILNKLDNDSSDRLRRTSEVALAPFIIPQPPALNKIEAERLGQTMIQRLLDAANSSEAPQGSVKKIKSGLQRLAGGGRDVDSWKAFVIRLIARGDLGTHETLIKSENHSSEETQFSLNDVIRNALYAYILDDFRSRMITAFDWLNEEWYNDRLHAGTLEGSFRNYDHWALKLLNGIFPYVDARDKNLLIRFLSEIPEVTAPLLEKFKDLAKDPERVIPVVNAL
jgi:symplekin